MSASITDKFKKVGVAGTLTTMAAPGKAVGASTANGNSLTNWPTDTGIIFAIRVVDADGEEVAGTYTEWYGTISGNTISNLTLAYGTDQVYAAGSTTQMFIPLSAKEKNDTVDGITEEHSQLGYHSKAMKDSNGNAWLTPNAVSNAVNSKQISNAAANTNVVEEAIGSSTDIGIVQKGKGAGGIIPKLNAPQGFLINGKLSVSVASNNITVAIKTLAGNDPSANDPVFVRIGDTIRTITAALSVTRNAGTNWFGSGSTGFATTTRNYYAYLGYNATDGVVIGFALFPTARKYNDFSTTTTNTDYGAISTVTNAASTDVYENIGLFQAILSATASFNWSLPGTPRVSNKPTDRDNPQVGAQSATVATSENTTSTSPTDLSTVGPTVTINVPESGKVMIICTASFSDSAGSAAGFLSYLMSGANSNSGNLDFRRSNTATQATGLGAALLITGLTPGQTTVKLQYAVSTGTGSFSGRTIQVIPMP